MSYVLVAGGAGYIGSHTCAELLEKGYDVVVIDNFSNGSPKAIERVKIITGKEIKLYNCDVRDKNKLSEIFKSNEISAVIHFAGLKAVGESHNFPLEYYDDNVCGTLALLEVARDHGVKKIIFSSSATVYGDAVPPYEESMDYGRIINPYGRTKRMIEEILFDLYASDQDWSISILRYFNPVGAHPSGLIGERPKGTPNNIMPFISYVAIGALPKLTVFGGDYDTPDGTCVRDYVHVVDLAQGHVKALERILSRKGIDVYNLGVGRGVSVLELIKAFEKASGRTVNYSIGERRKGDSPICFADVKKAGLELGWRARYGIGQMCEDAWRWQTKNPGGYGE